MSSKSIDELIQILNSSPEVEKELNDVQMFIRDLEIVESKSKVRSAHIFWAYMLWKEAGNGKEAILNRNNFFKQFKKYFKSGRVGKYRYYFINGDNIEVNRRVHMEIMKDYYIEKEHQKWQKRKKET